MLITFIEPTVLTQDLFYQLTSAQPSVRIFVGFLSDNTNIATTTSLRNWYIRDINGILVTKGQVSVQLNTFNSYVDVSGLPMNSIFTFAIDNDVPPATTTIISTIDVSLIIVINEKHVFTGTPVVIGDLILVQIPYNSITLGSPPTYSVQFPSSWNIIRNEGNGLVFSNGQIYAYAPTVIYTKNRNAPTSIDFSPFRGLSSQEIPIYQVPTIENQGNFLYSIAPSTRVLVKWKTGTTVGNMNYSMYDSQVPISSVDVKQVAPIGTLLSGIRIVAVF